MFIKLTRLDGTPIWLNAAFVVTVEPRRGGGAIVVPIGDGLDYDVRETPENVLSMLEGVPAPAVVPVPAPKMLAPTHENLSLGPETAEADGETPADVKPGPEESPASESPRPEPEVKAAKKPAKPAAKKLAKSRSRTKKPALALSEEQVERLRKMAPGSVKKLTNTLATQFKVEDAEAAVKALEAHAVVILDKDHVIWQ